MSSLTSSQLMKPYRRGTLMAFRWIRRLMYGRGHGIHSPMAFGLVYTVVRPYSGYYDYPLLSRRGTPDALLWYRMLARFVPREIAYRLEDRTTQQLLEWAQSLAVSTPREEGQFILATDQVREAERVLTEEQEAVVLLLGVRKGREREQEFVSYLESGRHKGVVLDLYDSAILLNNNNELYYYRTTL